MSALADQQLLERWMTARDAHAFHTLTSRHASMVYNTARRILQDGTEAEDVTQECFLKLAEGHLQHTASLPGWLYTAAVRLSLNRIRSNRRRAARDAAYQAALERSPVMSMDDLQGYVDEALSNLPDKLRHCLVAHFLEGRTQEDIASELGATRWTISRRIRLGLKLLRAELNQEVSHMTIAVLSGILASGQADALPAALVRRLGAISLSGERTLPTPGDFQPMASARSASFLPGKLLIISVGAALIALAHMSLSQLTHSSRNVDSGAVDALPGTDIKKITVSENELPDTPASPERKVRTADRSLSDATTKPASAALTISNPNDYSAVAGSIHTVLYGGTPGMEIELLVTGLPPFEAGGTAEDREKYDDQYLALLEECELRYRTSTDAEGKFEVNGITQTGMAEFTATAPGYTTLRGDIVLERGRTTKLDLQSIPASLIRGHIALADGSPAEGALVMHLNGTYTHDALKILNSNEKDKAGGVIQAPLFDPRLSRTPLRGRGVPPQLYAETRSDEHGAFSLWVPLGPEADLELSDYPAQATLWVYHGPEAYAVFMHVATNQSHELLFRLPSCNVWVSGIVTDNDGKPADGHEVSFGPDYGPLASEINFTAVTDDSGAYQLGPLDPAQAFHAQIKSSGGKVVQNGVPVADLSPGVENIRNFQLNKMIAVEGRVESDRRGTPIPGISILARKKGGRPLTVKSDESGRFYFDLCDGPGQYDFIASIPLPAPNEGNDSSTARISTDISVAENNPVVIHLPETWTFRCHITDNTGRAIDSTTVRLFFRDDPSASAITLPLTKAANGAYELRDLPLNAPISLHFEKTGYTTAKLQVVSPPEGRDAAIEEVMRQPIGGISGVAVGEDGAPFANVLLSFRPLGEGYDNFIGQAVDTDDLGMFEFKSGIPAGRVQLQLSTFEDTADGEGTDIWNWTHVVEIAPGETLDLGTVTLSKVD